MGISYDNDSLSPKLIRNGTEVQLQEHILNLPILTITTEGGAAITSKETYVNATFELRNTTQPFTQTGQIRGRGNSTWNEPKKPYKVKFTNAVAPLGMISRKDWVLLANWYDPSSLRSAIAFELGYRTSLAWTPGYRYVDVVLNGTKVGVYQLVDHIEIKNNRININEMTAADVSGLAVTGGYSMEIDVRLEDNNEPGFRTRLNVPITFDEPDGKVLPQVVYMRNFIQDFEDVLFSNSFADPVNGFRKYVDINSFIDWYWVNEFMANNDSGFGASVKLYKKRDTAQTPGKLFLGPLWDFDRSIGVGGTYAYHAPNVWWTRNGASWIKRMMEDATFVTVMNQRWVSLRNSMLADDFLYTLVNKLTVKLHPQLKHDKQIWNLDANDPNASATYLINWLQQRVAFIDSEIVAASDTTPPTVPQNLVSSAVGPYEATFSWSASSDAGDELGVTGYRVLKNGVTAGLTAIPYSDTLTSIKIPRLKAGTQYNFEVQARDATGNWSGSSAVHTLSTLPTAAGGNGLSIFLDDAPGVISIFDDARPITLGTTFYPYGNEYGFDRFSVGGRVWVPDDGQTYGQIMIGIWTEYNVVDNRAVFDLSQPATQAKTVTITNRPGWVEAIWDTPVELHSATPVLIAYHFVDAPNKYLASPFNDGTYSPNLSVSPGIYLSGNTEAMSSGVNFSRGYYKYGDAAETNVSGGYYGADILVNEPTEFVD